MRLDSSEPISKPCESRHIFLHDRDKAFVDVRHHRDWVRRVSEVRTHLREVQPVRLVEASQVLVQSRLCLIPQRIVHTGKDDEHPVSRISSLSDCCCVVCGLSGLDVSNNKAASPDASRCWIWQQADDVVGCLVNRGYSTNPFFISEQCLFQLWPVKVFGARPRVPALWCKKIWVHNGPPKGNLDLLTCFLAPILDNLHDQLAIRSDCLELSNRGLFGVRTPDEQLKLFEYRNLLIRQRHPTALSSSMP